MKYEPEAIYITPPTGFDQVIDGTGALDRCRSQVIPFTTASGAATQITVGGPGWYTMTADQNVQVRFWSDNTLNANAASDFPLWQYAYLQLVLDGFVWVRLKGLTSSGNFYIYPSNR